MSQFLIVYGTEYGQTEKIAMFMAEKIRARGHDVDIAYSRQAVRSPESLQKYDGILVGAPVYMRKYPSSLRKWVRFHARQLSNKPTAFFSVCLGILQNDDSVQKELRGIAENFFTWSGWRPGRWVVFAGALRYSKYNWILKRIMRGIAKKAGSDTDISYDYEYTKWDQVLQFTLDFLSSVERPNEARTSEYSNRTQTSPGHQ